MRLSEWLEGDAVLQGSAAVSARDEPDLARARLESAAEALRERVEGIPGVGWPVSMTNATVGDLHRCEGLAVARAPRSRLADGEAGSTWAALAGAALDAYVAHVVHEGPVADPVADLISMWCAQRRGSDVEDLLGMLEDADPDVVSQRRERLSELSRAAAPFAVLAGWAPRVEVPVGCTIGGALALRGRVDVMLGGPGTGRPAVLIEVKSRDVRPDDHAQLRHYVMLSALRDGQMPAAAGVWSPGDTVADVLVSGRRGELGGARRGRHPNARRDVGGPGAGPGPRPALPLVPGGGGLLGRCRSSRPRLGCRDLRRRGLRGRGSRSEPMGS